MAACTTLMVTKAAFAAIGGRPPHNARRKALFPIRLPKPHHDLLTAARGERESYSDVILRLAKLEAKINAKGLAS